MTEEIEAEARKICQGKLQISKVSTKYGEGYSITIKADGIQLGRNGVNLSSQFAQDFRLTSWRYEMTDADLGKEALINGKRMFLAGVEIKRNGNVRIAIQDEQGNILLGAENSIVRFGGKAVQTITVGR
jgi:hypothetical protein